MFENSVVTALKVNFMNNVLIALAGTSSGQLLKVNEKLDRDFYCALFFAPV